MGPPRLKASVEAVSKLTLMTAFFVLFSLRNFLRRGIQQSSFLNSVIFINIDVMKKPTPTALGLGITFPALAFLAVAARFWARRIKSQKLMADDYMIIPALVDKSICKLRLMRLMRSPDFFCRDWCTSYLW